MTKHLSLIGILSLSLVALIGCSPAQDLNSPLAGLKGRWVWIGHRDKLGLEKACAAHGVDYEASADKRTVTYRYLDEEKDGKRELKTGSYLVLYQDGKSVAMYLNGEDRKYRNGDRYIWVMQLEKPDLFFWRILTIPRDESELLEFARVRCSAR